MKTVAILQSNYIPWKGYFDLIICADVFVIYDEVQFTRRDWRNRNLIKTADGLRWLTVPVSSTGKFLQTISETQLVNSNWPVKHWKQIQSSYGKSVHFDEISEWLKPIYLDRSFKHLSALNEYLIKAICSYLEINTDIIQSSELNLVAGKTDRLVGICEQVGATCYLSGPSARSYIDPKKFADTGISLCWASYENYPVYPQLHGDFEHRITILDLLFNTGREAVKYMKAHRVAA